MDENVGNEVVNTLQTQIPDEANKILQSLGSTWDDVVDPAAFMLETLKNAETNAVFEVNWSTKNGNRPRKAILRIYGEALHIFFDRKDEIMAFECMSEHRQGPRLVGHFPNGRIEEFIHARTLSTPDLCDPEISCLIATKLRKLHDLNMPGSRNIIIWNRLRNWCAKSKQLCTANEAEAFRLDDIEMEIQMLENKLSNDSMIVKFCHNDLQCGNMMFDDDTKSVTLIDYEYAGYNPVAYDLGGYFCEMVADYYSDTPHILNYERYPELEYRQRFIRTYLRYPGNEPSDHEVEQLVRDAEKYTLAAHLHWCLWAIIWGKVDATNFDTNEYVRQRFQRYWSTKPILLGNL